MGGEIVNYITAIMSLFQGSDHRISERSKILDVEFNYSVGSFPQYSQLVDLIHSLPQRDNIVISLTNENDDLFYLSSQDFSSQQKYDSYQRDCEYSEQMSAKISINKNVKNGVISIYDFSSFAQELSELPLESLLSSFSALLSESNQLIFEVFDKEILFKTKTMMFSSASQEVVLDPFDREHRINVCSETTHFYEQAIYQVLPDDFHIEINFEGNPLSEIFDKITHILSLIYLSSSASLNHEILEIQVTGQRTLEFQCQCATAIPNPELYKIYNWIYTGGNSTDKALIARNILCLHCRFSDIQKIDGKTFASIQSNYNLYLKDNVSQYIQLTNKLAEFISEEVTKTGDYAISMLEKFKANLLAIFGFLFTVVLANIVSDSPLDNILTHDVTFILEAVLFGSAIYLVVCVFETKYKMRRVYDSYTALKKNYSSVLTPEDINLAFDEDHLMTEMRNEVIKGMRRYTCLWGIFILVSFLAIEIVSSEPFAWPLMQKLFSMIKNILTIPASNSLST